MSSSTKLGYSWECLCELQQFPPSVDLIILSSPSLLGASASRLLDERDNVDEQRMAVEMGINVVMLYQISLHVRTFAFFRLM